MALPASAGVSVLFVLADQWKRERNTETAMGVRDVGALDELVARRISRADRSEQTRRARAETAAAMGGEVIGGW